FRVMLPKGTLTIEREGKPRDIRYLDIVRFEHEESGWKLPPKLALEVDLYMDKRFPSVTRDRKHIWMQERHLFMHKPAASVSAGLDWSEFGQGLGTHYAAVMRWQNVSLGETVADSDKLEYSPRICDDADDVLLTKIRVLAINVLLFLSQKPMVY